MLNRLRRWIKGDLGPAPEDVCHCMIKRGPPLSLIQLNEMPLAWETEYDMPASLRPGDLRLERMALGFDETRGAGRTLEYYDPDLSCGCPGDCVQHAWRAPA